MKNSPFFWFLVKNSVIEKSEAFPMNFYTYSGLAILYKNKDIDEINAEIRELIRKGSRNPLAIYLSKKIKITPADPIICSATIYPLNKQHEINKKSAMACFPIKNYKKHTDVNNHLLNQLSEYFIYNGFFPNKEVAVEIIDFTPGVYSADFFLLLQNLGIRNYIVPYSQKNFLYIKEIIHEVCNTPINNTAPEPELINQWRIRINALDKIMIDTLVKRMQIVREMGKYKRQNNLPYFQAERWHEILSSRKKNAKEAGLDEQLVEKIFTEIHLNNLKTMLDDEN
ncbi:MAG TPA: chorismate mutase [Bacteroidales bacterium]|nr:chorismate mutase [Bacteroidales bacterium]HNZ41956.1 chorismate mutase [Bacteroidales bacterium]HPB24243.1 chorismate mutase [Bacteroidales bacterium]HPI28934.1 chorismate mutase [Bacteroidales bacterium]HQN14838.1 chorismate mutase [Bacteroidales bacterium]